MYWSALPGDQRARHSPLLDRNLSATRRHQARMHQVNTPQDVVALDVVTQRSDDVDEHDCGQHVGEDS
jgi:hypothetical protein